MKHYLKILLVFLLTGSFTAQAQNQADYTFTIHIGAFINPELTDFENIRSFGYLYAQKFNSLQQIYMGDYPSEQDASKILAQVKNNGYPDAFITRRSLENSSVSIMIQLGIEKADSKINWANYASAGPLYTYQSGNTIRVTTGPFEQLDDAQNRLTTIGENGFEGAFIKNINSVLLHKVTAFENDSNVEIPQSYESEFSKPPSDSKEIIAETTPMKSQAPDVMIKKNTEDVIEDQKEEPRPKSYEEVLVSKSPESISHSNSLAIPQIRNDVKRTSVLKLQEVLKLNGAYSSSLDGLYGPGTQEGYNEMLANNKDILKYKMLSSFYESATPEKPLTQNIISAMDNDIAVGVSKLKGQRTAISKAYQAYGIFALSGKNIETDKLMNEAIKSVFAENKASGNLPLDVKKDYTYSDFDHLIRHIRYVHSASKENVEVPCWLFEKHPKEANKAFDPANDIDKGEYTIQDCGKIYQWESIRLMETIMKEMTPDLSKIDPSNLAILQSKRAGLMLFPKAQSVEEYQKIDNWNTNLWNGLDKKEKTDPLYSRMITPLKVAYFQSWALLEDHFMNQDFTAREARGLSLSVLKTIVEPYLKRYSDMESK